MNILITVALLVLLAAAPAFAGETDTGFGDSYFSNTQPPGFSDPANPGSEDDAANAAMIEPAAGDETPGQTDTVNEVPRKLTQHEVAPVGPASAIGATPDDDQ